MSKRKILDRRIGGWLHAALLWPALGVMAVCGFRLARISNPGRIGHMAAEMDCFLKERALGPIPDFRPVLLLERRRAGNRALLDVFRQYVTVWDKRWQKLVFTPFTRFEAVTLPLGRPVLGFGEAARYPQVLALWGERPPAITLPERIEADGRALLARLGVPEDAWFVCVHAREGGYSPRDEHDHAHRNADIATCRPAMEAIVARGGWVVRVGDPTMRPLAPMRLADVFGRGLSVQRYALVFEAEGVTIEDNTPEEIRALTAEMLDRLDGRFETTDDDEDLQRRFRAHLRPCDYCFGTLSRIGRDWLRENRALL